MVTTSLSRGLTRVVLRPPPGSQVTMVERRTKALLVEDDPNIVDLVRSNLTVRGYDTCLSPDGSRALQLLETERPDIVLLDLMFPDADGFELCRQMRERSPVGIIVVSARGGQHDKVAALNYGADDYLTKPFGIEELMARITATLRRTRPAEPVEASALRIEVGDLVVDLEMSLVTKSGRDCPPDADGVLITARAGCQQRKVVDARAAVEACLGPGLCHRDRVRPGLHTAPAGQAGKQWRSPGYHHSTASRLSLCARTSSHRLDGASTCP